MPQRLRLTHDRQQDWFVEQLCLEILAVSCPLFLDSCHQYRNRRLTITPEDHSRVTQLLQKNKNTSDCKWNKTFPWNHQTKTVRGVAVTQNKRGSCALSSALSRTEEKVVQRTAWPLQSRNACTTLRSEGNVSLLM